MTHGQSLLTFAYLTCGDTHVAQDAVQSVFARLLDKDLSSVQDLVAYARRALVNELTSAGRRHTRLSHLLTRLAPPTPQADDPDAVIERSALMQALGQLPFRQRAVIVLRYYEDLPDPDIAAILGCQPATVRSAARRGLLKMQSTMPHLMQDEES